MPSPILKLTTSLLEQSRKSEPVSFDEAKRFIKDLSKVIRHHNELYWNHNAPEIEDKEYDELFSYLKKLEEQFPELVSPDSPTQKLAIVNQPALPNFSAAGSTFEEVEHLVPMISLDNTYNAEDLHDFEKRIRNILKNDESIEYIIEYKFDGIGIALLYEEGKLVRAATRGNGIKGEDITENVKTIESIPHTINAKGITKMEVRGEIIMPKSAFEKTNRERDEAGLPPYANPRNATGGALRQLDPGETRKRNLECFLYHISYIQAASGKSPLDAGDKLLAISEKNENISLSEREYPGGGRVLNETKMGSNNESPIKTQFQALQFLQKHHLPTHPEFHICKTIDEIIVLAKKLEETRFSLPFEVDGLVVKVNDFDLQQKLGATEHHPRWAVAYKFAARQAVTKLNNIVFQVGRTGVVTPVAELEPVQLAGVTIRNATLHNADEVEKKELMIGDYVLIERAGDVIPQVIKPVVERRTGVEKRFVMLTYCPECKSELIREEGEVAWRCLNANCPAQIFERIKHFASKDAMDIEGLGEKTVDLLLQEKKIASFADMYSLHVGSFEGLPGFADLAITNLLTGIERSKKNDLWRLIHGLGIRHVGKKTTKVLAQNVTNLWDLSKRNLEELSELPDIGPIVAQSIVDYFSNVQNCLILTELEKAGVNFTGQLSLLEVEARTALPFYGKTFVFTGNMEKYSREEAQEIVEKMGGKSGSSVSKNTTYLVTGDKPGSKYKKAVELDVKILSEEEFSTLVQS